MNKLEEFNIKFVGLQDGVHQFEYHIDKKFFDAFDFDEFNDADVKVNVTLEKKPTLLELDFSAQGKVNVPCDITGEFFDLDLQGSFPLLVKFGQEYNDDNEEVLIIPHEEFRVNVAQYIYELIVLSAPLKRIHPKVLDGTMENEILEKFRELEYKEEDFVEDEEDSTDPRWDKLKDLLTGKNE